MRWVAPYPSLLPASLHHPQGTVSWESLNNSLTFQTRSECPMCLTSFPQSAGLLRISFQHLDLTIFQSLVNSIKSLSVTHIQSASTPRSRSCHALSIILLLNNIALTEVVKYLWSNLVSDRSVLSCFQDYLKKLIIYHSLVRKLWWLSVLTD